MKNIWYKDRIIGAASIVLGIVIMALVSRIPVNNTLGDPGSGLFPMLAAALFIITGLGLVCSKRTEKIKPFLTAEQWKRLLLLYSIYILFYLGWMWLGYLIAAPTFLFIVCSLFSRDQNVPLWKRILFSIVLAMVLYVIFHHILGIRLPSGNLFG